MMMKRTEGTPKRSTPPDLQRSGARGIPFSCLSDYLLTEAAKTREGSVQRRALESGWAWWVQISIVAGILLITMAGWIVLGRGLGQAKKWLDRWSGQPLPVATVTPTGVAPLPASEPDIRIELVEPPETIVANGREVKLQFKASLPSRSRPVPDGTVARFEAAGGQVEPALDVFRDGKVSTHFIPDPWQEGYDRAVVVVRIGDVERAFSWELKPPPRLGRVQFETLPPKVKAGDSFSVTVVTLDTEGKAMPDIGLSLRVEPTEAGFFSPA
ncbi:MAG: hypothetical protein ABIN58_07560, partial [candidate division WOR-3 bacterium]